MDDESPAEETAEAGTDFDELIAFLRDEEERAEDGGLQDERAAALDAYNGDPYGDEEDGRSQVVTRDVSETVDYMTVAILRTMVSGDKAVEFDIPESPRQPSTPQQGQQSKPPTQSEIVTAAVSREFFQGQDGYRVLHDWIKAGLLEKSSVCKVCVEKQDPIRRESVVPAEALALMAQQGIKPIAAADLNDGTFAVAWLEEQPPVFRDYVTPNEEFRVAMDARDLDDGCIYDAFITPKTESDLRKMGFDVDDLGDDNYTSSGDILRNARDQNRGDPYHSGDYRTGANRRYWLREEYARFDLNGDGIAELLKVHRVGTMALECEEVDEQPGVIWCPFPMPSRMIGQSLADKTMDIQRISSVVTRQMLDGFYLTNKPRTYISESSIGTSTIDDLLNPNVGAIIRYTGITPPDTRASQFDVGSALALLEKLNGEKESRTGITRLNQGMDKDTLNKTATGTALMQAQGQQIEEYVARNFAEAFARLMLKKYRLMRKFGRPIELLIDGQLIKTDPTQWPEDANVVVRVGLGSGRKDQRIAYRQQVLAIAQQALMGGARMFTEENLFNNMRGLIADMNLGPVNELITDPTALPPAEDHLDPKMAEVQAKAMIEAEKQKADAQKAQNDHGAKMAQMQVDAALKQQQQDYDLQAKREAAALQAHLAQQKADFEAQLAQQTADRNYALAVEEMQHRVSIKEAETQARVAQNRPGGDLAE